MIRLTAAHTHSLESVHRRSSGSKKQLKDVARTECTEEETSTPVDFTHLRPCLGEVDVSPARASSSREQAGELRRKGFVVLKERLPRRWIDQASTRAGVALRRTKACKEGYYDVKLEPELWDAKATELWEPVISASRPEDNGSWHFHTQGLLATTPHAEGPWPKRPVTATAADLAVEAACGLLTHVQSRPSDQLRCIHVIVPLVAISRQVGAVGAAALNLGVGQILVIDDVTPHVSFGMRTKKEGPRPLLYWTYVYRSCAALVWGEAKLSIDSTHNHETPPPMDSRARVPPRESLSDLKQEDEKEKLSLTPLKVPSGCISSISKLHAGKAHHRQTSEAWRAGLLQRFLDSQKHEVNMEVSTVRARKEDTKILELEDQPQVVSEPENKTSLTSEMKDTSFLSGMFKKPWQFWKSRKSKKNQVLPFQDLTTT